MGEITFHNENVQVPGHDPEFLVLWIKHIVNELGFTVGAISYIFCSDEYILRVNKQYLSHDYYTDIITFNYNEDNNISGDIFISVDTVRSNSVEYGNGSFIDEINRVIIHGVLHLCGLNDKTDEEQLLMTMKEDWALSEISRFT